MARLPSKSCLTDCVLSCNRADQDGESRKSWLCERLEEFTLRLLYHGLYGNSSATNSPVSGKMSIETMKQAAKVDTGYIATVSG